MYVQKQKSNIGTLKLPPLRLNNTKKVLSWKQQDQWILNTQKHFFLNLIIAVYTELALLGRSTKAGRTTITQHDIQMI